MDGAFSVWGHFLFHHRQILLLPLEVLGSEHQEKVCQDSLMPIKLKTTLHQNIVHSEHTTLSAVLDHSGHSSTADAVTYPCCRWLGSL